MKQITASLFFLLLYVNANAQAPLVKQWDKRYGGTFSDRFQSFQQTTDGGFILGGHSASVLSGDKTQANWGGYDYWMVKIDSVGNKHWDKRFGGTDEDELHSIQQTADGGYILGGGSKSGIGGDRTQASWGTWDYWIVKTDANGNKQWDKRFGGTSLDILYCLHQTRDGGYVFGGISYSDVNGDKTQPSWNGSGDYWIIKTDAFGNKQWDKRYGGKQSEDFRALYQTPDGGYILGGTSGSDSTGDKTQPSWLGSWDYWIVKIDSVGNKQWDKTFGGLGGDGLNDIQLTSDGGFILSGQSDSDTSGDKTQPIRGQNDYWIVKIDSVGNKQWDKDFGGVNRDYASSLQKTSDGGYLVSGDSYSPIGADKSENNLGAIQGWIVKADRWGNKQWDKTIFTTGTDYISKAIQLKDGCYAIANMSNGTVAGYKTQPTWDTQGKGDYWIVKFCDTSRQCILTADITANKTLFCANDSAQVCAPNNFATYLWNTGQTTSCIKAQLAGNYYVTVTDNNGCTAESNRIAITVYPLPPVAISVNGDTLSVYDAVTQQWYLNGSAISNATSNTYIATQGGSYTVAVTDTNGCVAVSSPVVITGIDHVTEEDVVSVVQMAVDGWQLTVGSNWMGGVAEMFDANGRVVFHSTLVTRHSSLTPTVAKGVYLLRISSNKSSVVRKLVRL